MLSFFRNKKSANKIITLGKENDLIEVVIRFSLKAKHSSIRITPKNIVELVLPNNLSIAKIEKAYEIVIQKEDWIRQKLAHLKKVNHKNDGLVKKVIPEIIPIFAQEYSVVLYNQDIKQNIVLNEDKLLVSSAIDEANIAHAITLYLKQLIKGEILNYVSVISQRLQVKYNKISIKDTKSRWGSCASNGNLSFSWRLVFAPKYVMEYVVVHELCHIIEMNHSKRFWRLVEQNCPNYIQAKSWLKTHGRSLHGY